MQTYKSTLNKFKEVFPTYNETEDDDIYSVLILEEGVHLGVVLYKVGTFNIVNLENVDIEKYGAELEYEVLAHITQLQETQDTKPEVKIKEYITYDDYEEVSLDSKKSALLLKLWLASCLSIIVACGVLVSKLILNMR